MCDWNSHRVSFPDHVVHDLLAPDPWLAVRIPGGSHATTHAERLNSAWVGFATMIASLPIPGIITKYVSSTQREKMKRVRPFFHPPKSCGLRIVLLDRFPRAARDGEWVAQTAHPEPRANSVVVPVMNGIRMIKLFGWEPRITAQLNERREQELLSVRKAHFLDMSNNMCK